MKVLLTLAVLATSIFSASALAKKDCEAQYSVNGGANYSAFIDLGEVGGFSKKKKCFEKAMTLQNLKRAVSSLPAVQESHCSGKAGLKVYVTINVEGKRNDGVETFNVYANCRYKNGQCLEYNQVINSAVWK